MLLNGSFGKNNQVFNAMCFKGVAHYCHIFDKVFRLALRSIYKLIAYLDI